MTLVGASKVELSAVVLLKLCFSSLGLQGNNRNEGCVGWHDESAPSTAREPSNNIYCDEKKEPRRLRLGLVAFPLSSWKFFVMAVKIAKSNRDKVRTWMKVSFSFEAVFNRLFSLSLGQIGSE
jgi:hypothetical protein